MHMMQLNRMRPNHHVDKNCIIVGLCVVINKKTERK
jgi:hypothetical protein